MGILPKIGKIPKFSGQVSRNRELGPLGSGRAPPENVSERGPSGTASTVTGESPVDVPPAVRRKRLGRVERR